GSRRDAGSSSKPQRAEVPRTASRRESRVRTAYGGPLLRRGVAESVAPRRDSRVRGARWRGAKGRALEGEEVFDLEAERARRLDQRRDRGASLASLQEHPVRLFEHAVATRRLSHGEARRPRTTAAPARSASAGGRC